MTEPVPETKPMNIEEQFEKGKELLSAGDFAEAADLLEEVVQQRVEKYGDLAVECAEGYLWYGKALLEISRMETDHLLFAIKESSGGSKSFSDEVSSIMKTPAVPIGKSGTTETKIEGERNEEEDPAGGIDIDTLQIAWEWLDTARVILAKELESLPVEQRDARAKISFQYAEVLSLLGELGLETDNVEAARNDLELCLHLREQILPSTHRTLAETHFFLGMAFQLNKQRTHALAQFDKAKIILTTLLEDTSISAGLQQQLKHILAELDVKTVESQQLLSGIDNGKPDEVKKALSELLSTTPKPIEVKKDVPIRNLGVFGRAGKKRTKRPAAPPGETMIVEEPNTKQQKI